MSWTPHLLNKNFDMNVEHSLLAMCTFINKQHRVNNINLVAIENFSSRENGNVATKPGVE